MKAKGDRVIIVNPTGEIPNSIHNELQLKYNGTTGVIKKMGDYWCTVVMDTDGTTQDCFVGEVIVTENKNIIANNKIKNITNYICTSQQELSTLKERLKSIEWGYGACPACGSTDDKGHHSNCWLNKAIL